MSSQYQSLIDARNQWESDIKMYKDFLKGDTKTYEGTVSYTHLTLPTRDVV